MTKKIAVLILVALLFNGFRDARQLNDIAIVSAIGIDINDNNEYIITTQILNTQKSESDSSSSTASPVIVHNINSKSVQTALRKTVEESPNKLYLGHMELLLLSEKAASNDLLETLNFFLRDNEGNNNFMLAVTKDTTPQNILEKLSPIESNPIKSIISSLETTYEYEGSTTDYLLTDNLNMLLNDGRAIVTASVSLNEKKDSSKENEQEESNNQTTTQESGLMSKDSSSKESSGESKKEETASKPVFKVDNIAYYKERKFAGYLNKNESIVYNLLQNKLYNAVEEIGEGKDRLVVEIIDSKSEMKPKYKNGKYIMDIDIKMEGNITEVGEKVSENIKDELESYKQKVESSIKKDIEDAIYAYQHIYKEDIAGYKDIFYKKLNKEYKKIESEFYNKYFEYIKTNVNVEVEFRIEGGILSNAGRLQ